MPPDIVDDAKAGTPAALQSALAVLTANGADRFNPVRFRFIQSMADRSVQLDAKVANLVLAKTWSALREFELGWSRERARVAPLVELVAAKQPDMAEQVRCLFENNEFKAIRCLARQRHHSNARETLAALAQQLDTTGTSADSRPQAGDIDNVQATASPQESPYPHSRTNSSSALRSGAMRELKAAQFFRNTLQQQHADKLVSCALEDAPETSGPLNPQKLAIQSLAIMRELSPAYLTHCVSYLETLFWLEKIEHKNSLK